MSLLEVKNLRKVYTARLGGNGVEALKNVSFAVEAGEFVAIMGESGSGKTTLLNILAALDRPSGGRVLLSGEDMAGVRERDLSAFRRDNRGFVFQDFSLLDAFTVRDNIFLPLVLAGKGFEEMNARLLPLAQALGIGELLDKFPYELSGGQKQRTAVARALITRPAILLADEPTGALDSRASESLLRVFESLHEQGPTTLMVTHSVTAASHAKRTLFLRDGMIYHQLYRGSRTRGEMFAEISHTLTVMSGGENGHA